METLPPITSACAVTAIAMYPVDVARALSMSSATGKSYTLSQFVKTHGVQGLLKQGVGPEILRATWMRVVKLFMFPITFEALWHKPTSRGSWWEKGLAGALAVTPEVATITILEYAKIGLQLDQEKKFNNRAVNVIKSAIQQHGWKGLFIGWQAVQCRQMLWTGTYMATLGEYKSKFNSISTISSSPSLVNLLAGFAAGVTGALLNTPADIIRTNIQKLAIQASSSPSSMSYKPSINSLCFGLSPMVTLGRQIYASKGIRGIYMGFGFKSVHMGGSGALIALLVPVFSKIFGVKKDILG